MTQLYSAGCMYALRALMWAGRDAHTQPFTAREVCEKADIPESFTRKIFQSMVRAEFLKAVPGPGGGYRLLQKPSEISVLEVIQAVDGQDAFNQCVLKFEECDSVNPCALHDSWAKTKTRLLKELKQKTVQDLIRALPKKGKS